MPTSAVTSVKSRPDSAPPPDRSRALVIPSALWSGTYVARSRKREPSRKPVTSRTGIEPSNEVFHMSRRRFDGLLMLHLPVGSRAGPHVDRPFVGGHPDDGRLELRVVAENEVQQVLIDLPVVEGGSDV